MKQNEAIKGAIEGNRKSYQHPRRRQLFVILTFRIVGIISVI